MTSYTPKPTHGGGGGGGGGNPPIKTEAMYFNNLKMCVLGLPVSVGVL